MNILYIANTTGMYGANTSLIDMLEELQSRHVNVYVVVMRDGELKRELRKRGIRTFIVSYTTNAAIKNTLTWSQKYERLLKNMQCLSKIKEIIDMNHIDLVHSNASNIDIGAMVALRYHIPHVLHVREMLLEAYGLVYDFSILSNFFLHKADKVIAISEYVKKKKELGENSIVLYNGFNVEKYSITKTTLFSDCKLNILYCGVISRQKGIMDVVKAVRYIVQRGYDNIELSIVGGETPYWMKVRKYIIENKLEKYVRYYGYQPDMLEFRKRADIAVMSSRSEALGRVTIESMLGEVLVLGADCGATSELIQDGITGYLYKPGDIKRLAELMIDVKRNVKQNEIIVKNAKAYAMSNFNRVTYVDKLLDIYRECIKNK